MHGDLPRVWRSEGPTGRVRQVPPPQHRRERPYFDSTPVAQEAGQLLIMFETNSVSCGGFAGISTSFGAAPWAFDYGFEMVASNFSHALLHVGGQDVCYNVRPSWSCGDRWGARADADASMIASCACSPSLVSARPVAGIYPAACTVLTTSTPRSVPNKQDLLP